MNVMPRSIALADQPDGIVIGQFGLADMRAAEADDGDFLSGAAERPHRDSGSVGRKRGKRDQSAQDLATVEIGYAHAYLTPNGIRDLHSNGVTDRGLAGRYRIGQAETINTCKS